MNRNFCRLQQCRHGRHVPVEIAYRGHHADELRTPRILAVQIGHFFRKQAGVQHLAVKPNLVRTAGRDLSANAGHGHFRNAKVEASMTLGRDPAGVDLALVIDGPAMDSLVTRCGVNQRLIGHRTVGCNQDHGLATGPNGIGRQ